MIPVFIVAAETNGFVSGFWVGGRRRKNVFSLVYSAMFSLLRLGKLARQKSHMFDVRCSLGQASYSNCLCVIENFPSSFYLKFLAIERFVRDGRQLRFVEIHSRRPRLCTVFIKIKERNRIQNHAINYTLRTTSGHFV